MAAEVRPSTSPPANAEVEFALTSSVAGLPTQWAAVSTFVGATTTPLQSEFGVITAAVKPHSCSVATLPPTTLERARGDLAAAGAANTPANPTTQRATAPVLAIRGSIGLRVGGLALESERGGDRVHRARGRI